MTMNNSLESLVKSVARVLHESQIARLYKIPNDIKLVGGQVIHGEQTPADFMGFTASGRVMVVECKICKGTSLPLGKSGLKPHQLIAITEAHRSGGLGLLVWQQGDTVAVIDAGMVKTMIGERKSLPWKVIPPRYKKRANVEPLRFFWPFLPIRSESGSRSQ